jgi:hypothetical protein
MKMANKTKDDQHLPQPEALECANTETAAHSDTQAQAAL